LSTLLAIICIILGFIVGIAKVDIVFPALVWFVAAIAFDLLPLPAAFGPIVTRRE
jgi:hypothetical protein